MAVQVQNYAPPSAAVRVIALVKPLRNSEPKASDFHWIITPWNLYKFLINKNKLKKNLDISKNSD